MLKEALCLAMLHRSLRTGIRSSHKKRPFRRRTRCRLRRTFKVVHKISTNFKSQAFTKIRRTSRFCQVHKSRSSIATRRPPRSPCSPIRPQRLSSSTINRLTMRSRGPKAWSSNSTARTVITCPTRKYKASPTRRASCSASRKAKRFTWTKLGTRASSGEARHRSKTETIAKCCQRP
jgi:hypothetical protein